MNLIATALEGTTREKARELLSALGVTIRESDENQAGQPTFEIEHPWVPVGPWTLLDARTFEPVLPPAPRAVDHEYFVEGDPGQEPAR